MTRPRHYRGTMPAGSEAAFQTALVQLLGYCGWVLRYHTHNSERSAPGFPDVIAIHERKPWLLVAELKSAKPSRRATLVDIARRPLWLRDRAVTNDQAAWLEGFERVADAVGDCEDLLGAAPEYTPRVIVKLWRDDAEGWADIEATLGVTRAGDVRASE